jgi:hypothetical protein
MKDNNILKPEEKERVRLQEIDEIAPVINDEALVNEAKYGNPQAGILPYSAAELAYKSALKRVEAMEYADIDKAVKAIKGEP